MFYKIKCYILSVYDNKKIKIEVNDIDNRNKINNVIEYLQKEKKHKVPIDNKCSDHCYLLINKDTKYDFKNINYNELSDLYGLEVFITFYPKYYYFTYNVENIETNMLEKKICCGYSFIVKKITNIGIFN